MSKDKGSTNHKKAPADKTSGKAKAVSAYKSEGKSKDPVLDAFNVKPDPKAAKSQKH